MKNRVSIVFLVIMAMFAFQISKSPQVQADMIYSSIGPAPGYSEAGYSAGWVPEFFGPNYIQTDLAAGFTPTLDYTLDSISFAASYVSGTENSLTIYLASGTQHPDVMLELFSFANLSTAASIYSANSLTHPLLSAGTQYFFVFSPYYGTTITWWTGAPYVPPVLLTGYASGSWIPGTPLAGQTAFSVEGTPIIGPIPEPATMLLLGLGLMGLAGVRRKFKK